MLRETIQHLLEIIIKPVIFIQGLITEARGDIDPDALPFARKLKEVDRQGLREGASLVEVVCEILTLLVVDCECISYIIALS